MDLQPTIAEVKSHRIATGCGLKEAYNQILKENILEALERPCTQDELRFILRIVVKGIHPNAISA